MYGRVMEGWPGVTDCFLLVCYMEGAISNLVMV